jgi:hypothetical protein
MASSIRASATALPLATTVAAQSVRCDRRFVAVALGRARDVTH